MRKLLRAVSGQWVFSIRFLTVSPPGARAVSETIFQPRSPGPPDFLRVSKPNHGISPTIRTPPQREIALRPRFGYLWRPFGAVILGFPLTMPLLMSPGGEQHRAYQSPRDRPRSRDAPDGQRGSDRPRNLVRLHHGLLQRAGHRRAGHVLEQPRGRARFHRVYAVEIPLAAGVIPDPARR